MQWERLSNDVLTGAQAPTVALNWNASRTTLDDPPRQVRGTYGYYTVSRDVHRGQDPLEQRRVLPPGRVDGQQPPDAESRPALGRERRFRPIGPRIPSLEFGLGDKIAPRVGFAYDIKGDGQWKAYGSWGVFYDI